MIEFRNLLKENPLVRVVLNGGHQELDDATVPFALRFDPSIADKRPTHVLVISIPFSVYSTFKEDYNIHDLKYYLTQKGERRIYELSTIDYIQFNKPGKHNLIFVLFNDMSKEKRKEILQKGSLRIYYENEIAFEDVERGYLGIQNGYCEALVDIPEQFFAMVPKTGTRKLWWKWVNRWFLLDPVDECEFRKRALVAITIQPIIWILAFFLRFVVTTAVSIFILIVTIVALFCGGQPQTTWQTIGNAYWKFTLLYPSKKFRTTFEDWFDEDYWNEYKWYSIGKYEFRTIISPAGLSLQIFLWGLYIACIYDYFTPLHEYKTPLEHGFAILVLSTIAALVAVWHFQFIFFFMPFEKVRDWYFNHFYNSMDELKVHKIWLIALRFVSVSILCFLVTQIRWAGTIKSATTFTTSIWEYIVWAICIFTIFLLYKKRKKIRVQFNRTKLNQWFILWKEEQGRIADKKKRQQRAIARVQKSPVLERTDWLKQNMSIDSLPKKVDTGQIIAQTKSKQVVLWFKVSFWSAKSKVCKPYAK